MTPKQTPAEALAALIDACDYTAGNCSANEQVSAVIPTILIANAREALGQECFNGFWMPLGNYVKPSKPANSIHP